MLLSPLHRCLALSLLSVLLLTPHGLVAQAAPLLAAAPPDLPTLSRSTNGTATSLPGRSAHPATGRTPAVPDGQRRKAPPASHQSACQDQRIRTLTYQPNQVVTLATCVGVVIHIRLEPGETYLTHALGDAEAYAVTIQGQHVFIKPKAEEAHTNLIIVTERRCYHFALSLQASSPSSTPRAALYQLQFYYPDTAARRSAQAAQQQALQRGFAATSRFNVAYSYSGDAELVPHQVWDDGRFTYFNFAAHQDLPAMYVQAADGAESLINYHISPTSRTTLVLHKIHPRWILRLSNRVVAIHNDTPLLGPPDAVTATGTSSPWVERRVREASDVPF